MNRRPPRIALTLLRRLLRDSVREEIEGDLVEEYEVQKRSRWWFWRESASIVWSYRSSIGSLLDDGRAALRSFGRRPAFTLLAGTLVYPAWVWWVQPFALEPLVAGYLGLLLFAALCASYGLFVSSLTDSQVLAGFLAALPLLLLWLLSWNEAASAAATLPLLRAISLFNHFQPFSVGVVEMRDVFYFVFATGAFVWATLRVLEARQWRGRR